MWWWAGYAVEEARGVLMTPWFDLGNWMVRTGGGTLRTRGLGERSTEL